MKKTLIALAVFAMAGAAFAQNATISGQNYGTISNTVKSNATVAGPNSTSFSYAAGAASAASTVSLQWGGAPTGDNAGLNASISGITSTYNNGAAGNVASGYASGTASSTGTAYASASAAYSGNFNNPLSTGGYTTNGTLALNGWIDSSTGGNVNETTNTGASFGAATNGSFVENGWVGSIVSNTPSSTLIMNGAVADNKVSVSSAGTGTLTLNGSVLSNAGTQNATAATNVSVNGTFDDPVH